MHQIKGKRADLVAGIRRAIEQKQQQRPPNELLNIIWGWRRAPLPRTEPVASRTPLDLRPIENFSPVGVGHVAGPAPVFGAVGGAPGFPMAPVFGGPVPAVGGAPGFPMVPAFGAAPGLYPMAPAVGPAINRDTASAQDGVVYCDCYDNLTGNYRLAFAAKAGPNAIKLPPGEYYFRCENDQCNYWRAMNSIIFHHPHYLHNHPLNPAQVAYVGQRLPQQVVNARR